MLPLSEYRGNVSLSQAKTESTMDVTLLMSGLVVIATGRLARRHSPGLPTFGQRTAFQSTRRDCRGGFLAFFQTFRQQVPFTKILVAEFCVESRFEAGALGKRIGVPFLPVARFCVESGVRRKSSARSRSN